MRCRSSAPKILCSFVSRSAVAAEAVWVKGGERGGRRAHASCERPRVAIDGVLSGGLPMHRCKPAPPPAPHQGGGVPRSTFLLTKEDVA